MEIKSTSFYDKHITIIFIDNSPWWLASEMAGLLNYHCYLSEMLTLLSDYEKKKTLIDGQKYWLVNLSGVFTLIEHSSSPEKEVFREWISKLKIKGEPMEKETKEGMTIKQIAEVAGVNEKTIRDWVNKSSDKMSHLSDKMSEAYRTKKPAVFTLSETIAIIRAGGNNTLADLLSENANKKKKSLKLPCGKQLEELRKVYGTKEAAKRIDFVLGYKPEPRLPETFATPEQAELGFNQVKARVGARIEGNQLMLSDGSRI